MADPSSRHAHTPTYAAPLGPEGARVELYVPRAAQPVPPALVHKVAAGDRLDLLAQRYFGDPYLYWRIADANPTLAPEALLEPGTLLRIPGET
jgi:nucleoid-associated protein YgaU